MPLCRSGGKGSIPFRGASQSRKGVWLRSRLRLKVEGVDWGNIHALLVLAAQHVALPRRKDRFESDAGLPFGDGGDYKTGNTCRVALGAVLAQLGRASRCQREGRGFDPHISLSLNQSLYCYVTIQIRSLDIGENDRDFGLIEGIPD
jgi:hypothetical protein